MVRVVPRAGILTPPHHYLTTSPPHHLTTSPNTYPLAGFHPEDMRRDAGAYSATRGPLRAPGDPRGPPREPCGSQGPHGPGGCLSAPACGDFGPGPRFGIRHSPAVPHGQDRHGTPYSPVETVATHGIAAARATAGGRQGLLDLHPQRASIQAPTAATSGVGSKRPVRAGGTRIMTQPKTAGISPIAVNGAAQRRLSPLSSGLAANSRADLLELRGRRGRLCPALAVCARIYS